MNKRVEQVVIAAATIALVATGGVATVRDLSGLSMGDRIRIANMTESERVALALGPDAELYRTLRTMLRPKTHVVLFDELKARKDRMEGLRNLMRAQFQFATLLVPWTVQVCFGHLPEFDAVVSELQDDVLVVDFATSQSFPYSPSFETIAETPTYRIHRRIARVPESDDSGGGN